VGGVVALAVLGAGAYLLTGGEDLIPNVLDPGPDTPSFAYDTMTVKARSSSDTHRDDLVATAEGVAPDIQVVMTGLVQGTFVDPDTWGDYEGVFADAMTEEAVAGAAKDVRALTLGATADQEYEFVTPERGELTVTVFMGPDDQPAQAAAASTFVGTAESVDGTLTTVTSKGTYLLRRTDDGWRIFSYDVQRKEEAVEGSSPSVATPTAEASA
jgi:hypothetical protein